MTSARMEPLSNDEMDSETREIVQRSGMGGKTLNIFATLAHHPKLLKRWLVFGAHVLGKSTLSPRERELLILRTGWRCGSAYEWGQHVVIGRAAGVTDDDIARLTEVPASNAWSEHDALLVRAADELFDDRTLSDSTYAALASRFNEQQILDLLFAVGQYQLVSTVLRSLGVERDDGVTDAPMPGS
jgi:4-carboxymuconolactone decarboxylase